MSALRRSPHPLARGWGLRLSAGGGGCLQLFLGGDGDFMPYSDMFKRKMIQKMSGPNAISAAALSKQVDVSQTTLSKWLRKAGIQTAFGYPKNSNNVPARHTMSKKSPNDWTPEEKLKTVLEAASLSDDQLGKFLRRKGLHETHLQQWRLQMLNGLGKPQKTKSKTASVDKKQIRQLEKELRRKDKALAETAALLVLKKKVQQIWGDEDDDIIGKNDK
jgi:transposase-like protein